MTSTKVLSDFVEALVGGVVLDDQQLDASLSALIDADVATQGELVSRALFEMFQRGVTSAMLIATVNQLRSRMITVPLDGEQRSRAIDVVGTGGDGASSINISTLASLVAAGAGAVVIKHGNRAATSKCGSADLLEALGVRLHRAPVDVANDVAEVGFGFCFAPTFHPALAPLGPLRRALGIPTIFNLAGPLANPARPERALIGVGRLDWIDVVATAAATTGVTNGWIVGAPGLDELSPTIESSVIKIVDGQLQSATNFRPDDSAINHDTNLAEGGHAEDNLKITERILDGDVIDGRAEVVLNAAAALVIAGVAAELSEGVDRAQQSLDSGAARRVLTRLVARHQ
jgi:anthranilate phosphoribosyltransferase